MFATIRQTVELLEQQHTQELTDFSLSDYATTYETARDKYLAAAEALKLASGPYKAARDAYVAAAATYTKSLYD